MIPLKTSYKKTKGLTLMELLIAMVIGLMLLGGAITMFMNNKVIYKQVNEVGRMQENARFALEMLTRDIRMAGFYGCHHDVTQVTNFISGATTAGNFLMDHTNGLEGIEGASILWSPSGNPDAGATHASTIGARFLDTTVPDAITVRYFSGEHWDVVDDNDPDADTYEAGNDAKYMTAVNEFAIVSTEDGHPDATDSANNFAPGELLAISNCVRSDIFQLTTQCASSNTSFGCAPNGRIRHENGGGPAGVTPGNTGGGNFSDIYGQGSKVRRYMAARYFIGNGSYGGPSLFREYPVLNNVTHTITINTQELLEGVENMQIMYGADADGDGVPENYLAAGAAGLTLPTEWATVATVKIALLLRTVQQGFASGVDTKNNYDLLGQAIDPVDLAVKRRVVSSTIQLRNRIFR